MRVTVLFTPQLLAWFEQLPFREQVPIRAGRKALSDEVGILKLKPLVPPRPPWFAVDLFGYRWHGFTLTDEQAEFNRVTSPALMIAEIVRDDELRERAVDLLDQARADFEASGDDE